MSRVLVTYADWDQVEDFATRFAATVREAAPALDV